MSDKQAKYVSRLLIPLTGGIALSLAGCGDDPGSETPGLTQAEAANDYMAASAAEFCTIRQTCFPEGFAEEYDAFDDCVELMGVDFRAEAYAVSDECGDKFMEFVRCSGPISLAAYEGAGCDYQDQLGNYGGTLVEEYGESYYFPCPDEYDDRYEACGEL